MLSQALAAPTQVGTEAEIQNHSTVNATAPIISSSADTPVNAADRAQIDVTREAVAAAPVNAADTMMTNEAVAAPEVAQPNDAIQAAPEADLTDAPVNASPETTDCRNNRKLITLCWALSSNKKPRH